MNALLPAPSLEDLVSRAARLFREQFDASPTSVAAAPGRVNLIGEHTDYNGGFVLPMAIDRFVVACGRADARSTAFFFSEERGETAELSVAEPFERSPGAWSNYAQGVVAGFVTRGVAVPPFSAVALSSVPTGGGLSSSAALEVATATLLESLTGTRLDPIEKALLCQRAEHDFAGVPCGIMDQFSSVLCQADALMLLDCRSQAVRMVPFLDDAVSVLIANSNVRHALTGGEYAQRRAQCEAAAARLGVEFLRDASRSHLESQRAALDETTFRRARHVVGEIERTVEAADAIERGEWTRVGELMYASHASLRDDYEVSCAELDALVEIAGEIGLAGGVFGSRMTGGGFGGCTVSLVKSADVGSIAGRMAAEYRKRTGITPTLFASRPSAGATILST